MSVGVAGKPDARREALARELAKRFGLNYAPDPMAAIEKEYGAAFREAMRDPERAALVVLDAVARAQAFDMLHDEFVSARTYLDLFADFLARAGETERTDGVRKLCAASMSFYAVALLLPEYEGCIGALPATVEAVRLSGETVEELADEASEKLQALRLL